MKLLFITDGIYPELTANSEIAFRLALVLRDEYKCDISFLYYGEATEYKPADNSGFKYYPIRSLYRYKKIKKIHNKFLRRFMLICSPECLRCAYNFGFNRRYYIAEEYRHAIIKLIKAEKYDCIIAMSLPYAGLVALSRIKTSVPYIAYKLDPWFTNRVLHCTENDYVDESKADERAAAIIITDLIEKDLIQKKLTKYLFKSYVLNFPNIIQYKKETDNIPLGKGVHFLFVGRLYDNIRSPQYTFSLFRKLSQDGCYLHVVGHSENDLKDQYSIPDNIIFHGRVDSEMALHYMQSADILVNIGNTVLNQMPSKLLTYISLGKPILNIIKDWNCPTVSYLERYPLALSVLETPEPRREDVEKIRGFVFSSKEKKVPFQVIKERYSNCTSEYVGQKLYEIIKKVSLERCKMEIEKDNII